MLFIVINGVFAFLFLNLPLLYLVSSRYLLFGGINTKNAYEK